MSEPGAPLGPDFLMQLFTGAQASGLLKGAIELGLFGALASGPLDAAAVAERVGCPPRSTGILLDALSAIGLMQLEAGRYRLAPVAAEHLVPGKPMYMGDAIGIFGSTILWQAFDRVADAARNDGTVMPEHAETPGHLFWETFARSSAALAMPASMALANLLGPHLAARPHARVLDVAAGSGIYGFAMLRTPGVEVTLLDWPNVLDETRKSAQRLGVDASRVRYLPGDLHTVDFGGPYDAILLSNVYHHFDPPTCLALTRKVAAALAPGGRLAVNEPLTDGPHPGARMFSVVMLVWTRHGQAYRTADYAAWFTEAGLSPPEVHPTGPGFPGSWLIATKR